MAKNGQVTNIRTKPGERPVLLYVVKDVTNLNKFDVKKYYRPTCQSETCTYLIHQISYKLMYPKHLILSEVKEYKEEYLKSLKRLSLKPNIVSLSENDLVNYIKKDK